MTDIFKGPFQSEEIPKKMKDKNFCEWTRENMSKTNYDQVIFVHLKKKKKKKNNVRS